METIAPDRHSPTPTEEQKAIAEAWYRAVGRTGYVPLAADQVRAYLLELADELIAVFTADFLDLSKAEQVGAALAGLHFLRPEALAGTLEVLGWELIGCVPEEEGIAMQPRLVSLLGAVSAGFLRQATMTILAEQEETHNALVNELRAAEKQVRQAHEQLEARVQERTVELAVANEGLRAEIAERRLAEQALHESQERWRSLVENAPDLVLTLDPLGRVLFINRLPEVSQTTIEQLIGAEVLSQVQPSHRPAFREALDAAFQGQRGGYLEIPALTFGGKSGWYAVRLGPVLNGEHVTSVMAIVRDISEERRIQELKDNLIRDVSHELRSPLAKVRMSLDVLSEVVEAQPPDRERAVRIGQLARRNVDRLLQTVEGILDLTKLEAGIWQQEQQMVSLEDLVAEAMQQIAPLARSKKLRLRVDLPDGPLPAVKGDRERLFRVLLNLLDNAVKFTAEGGVVVSASQRNGLVEVAVADTGQGMEPEVLARVFERFYQETAQAEGVGIGLTICRAVVEAHGGRIWGESLGKGEGATFRFTLPVGPQEDEA